VILAAFAPLVVPGFGNKAVLDLSQVNADNRVHVSPLVTVGALLRNGNDTPVFQVQSDHRVYWRMVGLDQVDANGAWNATPEQGVVAPIGQPLPQTTTDRNDTQIAATFTVKNDLAFTTLPVPSSPKVLLSSADSTTWFPGAGSLSVAEWPDADAQYHVLSGYATPTARDLRASASATTFATDTAVPEGPDVTEIKGLAINWIGHATNDFDKVMAIQQHLLDPGQYRYDKTARYEDSFAGLVDFLERGRAGFCEQFASAMAVMLRTLGIPARVATGFTPGTTVGLNTYDVSTDDLHAWVEVPFDGYGWLPFEPTPGTSTVNPEMSSYAFSSTGGTCQGGGCGGGTNGGGVTADGRDKQKKNTKACTDSNPLTICGETKGADSGGGLDFGSREGAQPGDSPERSAPTVGILAAIAAVIALAILAGIPLTRWLGRRRALAHAREPRELILATYDVFSERAADLGLGRGPGETPREYRQRIEATDLLTDGHMERLTGTVVRAAYSTRPVTREDALDVTADADQVIRDLRRSTSLRRRIVGIYRRD
jgi:transglutaminase-like putative cysteine protease